jgi:hypothetical protein
VRGGPVGTVLAVPVAADGEALGKGVVEGVVDTLGETREEVKTGVTWGRGGFQHEVLD